MLMACRARVACRRAVASSPHTGRLMTVAVRAFECQWILRYRLLYTGEKYQDRPDRSAESTATDSHTVTEFTRIRDQQSNPTTTDHETGQTQRRHVCCGLARNIRLRYLGDRLISSSTNVRGIAGPIGHIAPTTPEGSRDRKLVEAVVVFGGA